MAAGVWRAQPVVTAEGFADAYIAGCRTAEPALAGLAPVVVDVRGVGWILVVFAGPSRAYLCRTRLVDPDVVEAVMPIDVPSETLADDGIDIALYTSVTSAGAARILLVGRVGPVASLVIARFDDEKYIFGSHAGGWYVMWWAGTVAMAGVSATNNAHVVLSDAVGTLR